MSEIKNKLKKFIKETENNKSSHWLHHLDGQNFEDIYHGMGFGSFAKKTLIKSVAHKLLSILTFGKDIFNSREYMVYKKIFDKMNRQIDTDALRHIFTFKLLKQYIEPKSICVIGDGKSNFVLGAIMLYPESKIFSVNLSETLINDYLILKKFKILDDNKIQVITSINDKIDFNKKLYLVPASLKKFLSNIDIDLFVNIASFQEMNINEIKNYMDIIKQKKSLFYCCNREYKKLYGNEELYFDKYPWGDGFKIFDEDCPWHQKYYSFKPNFIHKYDGNIKHCLVKYNYAKKIK